MKKLLLFCLLASLPAFGQAYSSSVLQNSPGNYGRPVPFASVMVCPITDIGTPCTSRTTTYTDYTLTTACTVSSGSGVLTGAPTSGTGCNNPGTADANGNFTLYVPTGQYRFCSYAGGWLCQNTSVGGSVALTGSFGALCYFTLTPVTCDPLATTNGSGALSALTGTFNTVTIGGSGAGTWTPTEGTGVPSPAAGKDTAFFSSVNHAFTCLNSSSRCNLEMPGFIQGCIVNGVAYVGSGVPFSTCWASSDIGAQIAAAVTAFGSGGGVVAVTAGTYTTSTPVSITQSNISIVGAGSANSQITYNGTGAFITMFPSSFSILSGPTISGMTIISGNQLSSQYGIKLTDITNVKVKDAEIDNFSGTSSAGIYLTASTHWSERHVYEAILQNDTNGILIDFTAGTFACATTFGYGTFSLWVNEGTGQTGINVKCGEFDFANLFMVNNMSGTSPVMLTVDNGSQFANNIVNIHQEGGTSPVRFNIQNSSTATMTGIVQNDSEVTDTISSNSTLAVSYQNDANQWEWRTSTSGTINEVLLDNQGNILSTNGAQHKFQEGAVRSGLSGYDVCYGDSTAHSILCSLNNGSFSSLLFAGQTNALTSAGTLDASAATGSNAFKVPVKAGAVATASGAVAFDSTAGNFVAGKAGTQVTVCTTAGEAGCGGSGTTANFYISPWGGSTGFNFPTANTTRLFAFVSPNSISGSTKLYYHVSAADNSANLYDIGIYNSSGTLVCHVGATAGTTLGPSTGDKSIAWASACSLTGGNRYYWALTGNSNVLGLNGASSVWSPVCNVVPATGSTTSGGVLNGTVTFSADAPSTCIMPNLAIVP